MKIQIDDMASFGLALRAARRASQLRLDDLAAFAGVSKQFVSDAEHGKPTLQMGLVFKLLEQIGAHLQLDLPEAAVQEMQRLQAAGGVKPYQRRAPAAAADDAQG
ncbi:helix-turn-helix domain-containing protein [Azohydromonas lata]|uniref:helix-turn-helix domain-containing protein n=1 Tax=Azohydromonas lata TaxID=45677 RepID=UPI00082CB72E|nr:helix-turn-helix domain-containing protein [Azohydromonas lata]